jgi:predicted transcriptional regulator of viral defense system
LIIVTKCVTLGDMNMYSVGVDSSPIPAPMLADWSLSRGMVALTTAQVADLLGVPVSQVRIRLHSPVKRGEWVAPARGLWVPIPPQYRAWGAPPVLEFLDALMEYLGVSYYVGWLSAAAIHGSAHHAPQVSQIATSRSVAGRKVGRGRVQFFVRSNVGLVPTVAYRNASGDVPVSTLEVTCLDLVADPMIGGGIDNVATTVVALAEEALDVDKIAALAGLFPQAAVRRLGYILASYTELPVSGALRAAIKTDNEPSLLAPSTNRSGRVDKVWNLVINAELEVEI